MSSVDDTSDGSGKLSSDDDDECCGPNCLRKLANCQLSIKHNPTFLFKQTPEYLIISENNFRNYRNKNKKINEDYSKLCDCNYEWNNINSKNSNQLQHEWIHYHRNNSNLTSQSESKHYHKYYPTHHSCVQPLIIPPKHRYEINKRLAGGGCRKSPCRIHESNHKHKKKLKLHSTPSKITLKNCYCYECTINCSSNESQSLSCNCTSTSQEYYPDNTYKLTKHQIKCRKKKIYLNSISQLSSQSIINNNHPRNLIDKATSNTCQQINIISDNNNNKDPEYNNNINNKNTTIELNVSSSCDNCLNNKSQLNINEDFIEYTVGDDGAVDVGVMCIDKKVDVYDLRSSSMVDNINSVIITLLTIISFIILSVITWAIVYINGEEKIIAANITTPLGCVECAYYRCPESASKCLLGSVPDSCECCPGGRCAKLDGEACWNSSIVQLSIESRNNGFCARNYLCQLRNDLHEEDKPEAVCVCMEQSPACGNNNRTYSTPCALHEEAMRNKNVGLKLKHLGPCPSRPWITSPLENIAANFGQRVALNCEVRGFPVPDINWEFHSSDGERVVKLPSNEHGSTVHTSDGPESLMRTSWLQLNQINEKYVGTYQCIANNTIGEASTASYVTIL
ncbi:hypothetical protein PV325_008295 [Microctonus aethiopoides]|nr:hypothetical protein PV325_008295 [Microctonus aethiopoides]